MTEAEALRARRSLLFERLCQAADEIRRIDHRLMWLKAGKPGTDSGLPGNLGQFPLNPGCGMPAREASG